MAHMNPTPVMDAGQDRTKRRARLRDVANHVMDVGPVGSEAERPGGGTHGAARDPAQLLHLLKREGTRVR